MIAKAVIATFNIVKQHKMARKIESLQKNKN